MEKICLDTQVIIDFLRGESAMVEKVKYYAEEELCATSLTLFELFVTVNKTDIINQFVKNITPLEFNENCSLIASRVYNDLREIGEIRPIRNILNASVCIDSGAYLVTKNRKDYEKIRGLKLV
ncbi:MAG: type II toxin-antitoxin system VapC family toxin [Candidatus ainarchaeum sp.]|nr:type II toxin-antitoxin system VapC family toxin [Candidatus ainarchaeum sp.]